MSITATIMFKTKPRALPWAMFLLTAIMTTNCKHRCANLHFDTLSWVQRALHGSIGIAVSGRLVHEEVGPLISAIVDDDFLEDDGGVLWMECYGMLLLHAALVAHHGLHERSSHAGRQY